MLTARHQFQGSININVHTSTTNNY